MTDDTDKHGPRCARCGEQRQAAHGKGFRHSRNGVRYCDGCAQRPGPWILGPSAFFGAAPVLEHFVGPMSRNPATQHV